MVQHVLPNLALDASIGYYSSDLEHMHGQDRAIFVCIAWFPYYLLCYSLEWDFAIDPNIPLSDLISSRKLISYRMILVEMDLFVTSRATNI